MEGAKFPPRLPKITSSDFLQVTYRSYLSCKTFTKAIHLFIWLHRCKEPISTIQWIKNIPSNIQPWRRQKEAAINNWQHTIGVQEGNPAAELTYISFRTFTTNLFIFPLMEVKSHLKEFFCLKLYGPQLIFNQCTLDYVQIQWALYHQSQLFVNENIYT